MLVAGQVHGGVGLAASSATCALAAAVVMLTLRPTLVFARAIDAASG